MEAGWLVGGSPEARRLAAGLGSVGSDSAVHPHTQNLPLEKSTQAAVSKYL